MPPIVNIGVKGALITGGLGRPACSGLITALPFQLLCLRIVPPTIAPGQEGGSISLAPGEIHDLYQVVDGAALDGPFVNPRAYGKRFVKVTITSRFFKGEKEFLVPDRKARFLIKAVNVVNVTRDRINVTVSQMKKITTRATVKIKNFRWRIKHK